MKSRYLSHSSCLGLHSLHYTTFFSHGLQYIILLILLFLCFCCQVSPTKVLRTAFSVRGLSSSYIQRVFVKTEMLLKSKPVLSNSQQISRSRSSENLPTSQSQNNIQLVSHTLTIREVRFLCSESSKSSILENRSLFFCHLHLKPLSHLYLFFFFTNPLKGTESGWYVLVGALIKAVFVSWWMRDELYSHYNSLFPLIIFQCQAMLLYPWKIAGAKLSYHSEYLNRTQSPVYVVFVICGSLFTHKERNFNKKYGKTFDILLISYLPNFTFLLFCFLTRVVQSMYVEGFITTTCIHFLISKD